MARAALAAALLAAAGCDSVEDRVAKHHARGVALLAEGDADRAVLEFRNALRLNENHVPSRFEIAKDYEADGELKAAVANYRLVAELDATHLGARQRLAQVYLLGGALEEAQAASAAALAIAPQDPDALATAAAIALRKGDAAAADAAARAALAVDPAHVGAHVVLITARFNAGDRAGALGQLDERIAAAQADPTLNLLKLALLEQAGEDGPLVRHLRALAARFPEEVAYRKGLARQLSRIGDHAGAEAELRAIADARPEDSEAGLALAQAAGRRGGADAARAELERLVAAGRGPVATYEFALADLDIGLDRLDAAKERLNRLAAGTEPSVVADARMRLGAIALAAGDADAAWTDADLALAADPDHVRALALRAELLIGREKPREAIVDLRRAARSDPRNPKLMLLEARAHERAGSPDLVGERLAAATQASDYAPDIALRYAAFLVGRGQREAAETVLAEAARRSPADLPALAALVELRIDLGRWTAVEQTIAALRAAPGGPLAAERAEAAALRAQGRLDESRAALERLYDDPQARDAAMSALVAALVQAGETGRARALVGEALAADPKDPQALLALAELDLAAGDLPAAEAGVAAIIAAVPESPVGHIALVRLRAGQGDLPGAEAAARAGIASTEASGDLRATLAGLLETRGDFDGAIAEWQAIYDAQPDSPIAANNLASLIADHRAQDPEALARAAAISQRLRGSTTPEFQDTYGWIMFLTGAVEEAARSLAPAADALPANPVVQYHFGRVLAAVGRPDEARARLEAALALAPDFPMAESARLTLAGLPQAPAGQ